MRRQGVVEGALCCIKLYTLTTMSNTFTKEQLLAMDMSALREVATMANPALAQEEDRDALIYAILDAQADSVSAAPEKPRRPRITKRSSDHVYLATQTGESERFDTAKEERALKRSIAAKERAAEAEATQALLGDEPAETPKRKRGRPSKEELAARKALEEMQARQTMLMEQATRAMQEDIEMEEEAAPAEASRGEDTSVVLAKEQESDLPDFIVAQMQDRHWEEEVEISESDLSQMLQGVGAHQEPQDMEAGESLSLGEGLASEELGVSVTDAVDLQEQLVAKTPTTPVAAARLSPEEWERVAPLLKEGADFIVSEDVPVVEQLDFSLVAPSSSPATGGAAAQKMAAPDPLARFHQFSSSHTTSTTTDVPVAAASVAAPMPEPEMLINVVGVLELDNQNAGFLRSADYNYMPSPDDVYLSATLLRQYSLKMGDTIEGKARVPRAGEKYYVLTAIERVNGQEPEALRDRVAFEHLTPLFPDEQYRLSGKGNAPLSCRIVDLFAPIGKGQRALIVAQPKTGKTILMKQIANAIAANYPEAYLMMLLIDERPEEVTDMARTVNAEVISSTFDEPAARHVRIAQMVLEKAKRMVECGHDVVIFLDSITRLARAFNTTAPTSGKILTGGVDANALQKPKRFFGAARNIEGGGSLTIIATALIDTGSKMDEVIFEEFKGTGNMELQLDRSLANKRIFPAVNLTQSSTRRDDLLLDETTLQRMHIVRNYMADMNSIEAMNFLQKRLEHTLSNEEFIKTMDR